MEPDKVPTEKLNLISGDLRKIMPVELKDGAYTVAVILHDSQDDGVIRVLLPQWLSTIVKNMPDEERKPKYNSFVEKIFEAVGLILKK